VHPEKLLVGVAVAGHGGLVGGEDRERLEVEDVEGVGNRLEEIAVVDLAGGQGGEGAVTLGERDIDAVHFGLAAAVALHGVAGEDADRASVLVTQDQLAGGDRGAGLVPVLDPLDDAGAHLLRDDEIFQCAAEGFLLGVAVECLAGVVPEGDAALAVVSLDGDVGDGLAQLAEAVLALAQALLLAEVFLEAAALPGDD
jgi:hypothetical protein